MAAVVAVSFPPLAVVTRSLRRGPRPSSPSRRSFRSVRDPFVPDRRLTSLLPSARHCRWPAPAQPRPRSAQGAEPRRRVREHRPRLVLGNQPRRHLSYVSRQLADDFRCEPAELLGRQFTDLLSVDTGTTTPLKRARRWGSTCRPAFPSPTCRRRGERPGRPLVAFRQPGFRQPRPLPRLSRDRHRPYRAAPLGAEITRLARFDSLTGLPNRPMMRQRSRKRFATPPAARRAAACS